MANTQQVHGNAGGVGGNANNTRTTDANLNNSSSSSSFAGISMTTIIHVVTEILIVGAATYWLNSKIKTQEDNNKLLLERLVKCEEQITKQNEIITHHENALRQFHALIQGLPAPKTNQNNRHQNPQNQQQNPNQNQSSPPNKPQNKPQSKPQSRQPPQSSSASRSTQNTSPIGSGPSNPRKNNKTTMNNMYSQIEDVEDETEVQSGGEESGDIDDLLQDEINDLDEETGVECNEDECVVTTGNASSKKKSKNTMMNH
jgi:hypothetical protein